MLFNLNKIKFSVMIRLRFHLIYVIRITLFSLEGKAKLHNLVNVMPANRNGGIKLSVLDKGGNKLKEFYQSVPRS